MPFDAPLPAADLEIGEAVEPRRRWRGRIVIVEGSSAPAQVQFWVDLGLAADSLEGTGATHEGDKVRIAGARSGSTMRCTIHVRKQEADLPFECFGAISTEETEIEASASLPCVFPDTCGCFGNRGALRLFREDT